MKQYRQILYVIGIVIVLGILGYILLDANWGNFIETLLATQTP